jgi:transposase
MWYNIYECLSKRHLDVRLSNPAKTRAIASAKIKTDKLDAIKLAALLRGGYIAECYIPTRETMDLRELVRHRAALVRMRTKLKNKIHSIMFMNGTSVSYVGTHTFTKGYIEKLKELNDYRINGYLRIIESLNDEINTISKKILELVRVDLLFLSKMLFHDLLSQEYDNNSNAIHQDRLTGIEWEMILWHGSNHFMLKFPVRIF